MKTSNKGWEYCGNAQASVDGDQQIIIAAEVTVESNDKQQAVQMTDKTLENLEAAEIDLPKDEQGASKPIPFTYDNGYFSEESAKELESNEKVDPHIAVGRQKHNTDNAAEPDEPPSSDATAKERMAHKLRTTAGKECYAKRKGIVEPVFGQIKGVRGFRQFMMRGLKKIRGEWKLVCLTHNLLKIWRYSYALS